MDWDSAITVGGGHYGAGAWGALRGNAGKLEFGKYTDELYLAKTDWVQLYCDSQSLAIGLKPCQPDSISAYKITRGKGKDGEVKSRTVSVRGVCREFGIPLQDQDCVVGVDNGLVVFQLGAGDVVADSYNWIFYKEKYVDPRSKIPSLSFTGIEERKGGPVARLIRFNEPVFLALFPEATPETYHVKRWVEFGHEKKNHNLLMRATTSENQCKRAVRKSKRDAYSWHVSVSTLWKEIGIVINRRQSFLPKLEGGIVKIALVKGEATKKTAFAASKLAFESGRPVGAYEYGSSDEVLNKALIVFLDHYQKTGQSLSAELIAEKLKMSRETLYQYFRRCNINSMHGFKEYAFASRN